VCDAPLSGVPVSRGQTLRHAGSPGLETEIGAGAKLAWTITVGKGRSCPCPREAAPAATEGRIQQTGARAGGKPISCRYWKEENAILIFFSWFPQRKKKAGELKTYVRLPAPGPFPGLCARRAKSRWCHVRLISFEAQGGQGGGKNCETSIPINGDVRFRPRNPQQAQVVDFALGGPPRGNSISNS